MPSAPLGSNSLCIFGRQSLCFPFAPSFPNCVNIVSCTYLHCPLTFPRLSQAPRTLLAHTGQTSVLKIAPALFLHTFSKIKNYYIYCLERQKVSSWCPTTSWVPPCRAFCCQLLSSDRALSRARNLHLSPSSVSGLLPAHFPAFRALGMAALTSSAPLLFVSYLLRAQEAQAVFATSPLLGIKPLLFSPTCLAQLSFICCISGCTGNALQCCGTGGTSERDRTPPLRPPESGRARGHRPRGREPRVLLPEGF